MYFLHSDQIVNFVRDNKVKAGSEALFFCHGTVLSLSIRIFWIFVVFFLLFWAVLAILFLGVIHTDAI
jgi:hypothetical protein